MTRPEPRPALRLPDDADRVPPGTTQSLPPTGNWQPLAEPPTGHPDSRTLHDFAVGRLSPDRAADIERHLESCEHCGLLLADAPDDTLVGWARQAAVQTNGPAGASPPPAMFDPQHIPPELVGHARYEVEKLLGAGGMGAVYKAEHRLMERSVALKVINPRFLSSPAAVERFLKEVKAAARLNHRHIVTSFDAEQAGDLHFLVMEYVDGTSLDRLFAKPRTLPVPQVCQMIRHAAQGLAHAHSKGMVHRDIKPHNMMLTRDGRVKLMDFGLARLAGVVLPDDGTGPSLQTKRDADEATLAGAFLGTPDYTAPEQARDASAADARSDIYSLGATFYFLLAGQPPFPGGSVLDKLHAHATVPPPPIEGQRDDVPAGVLAILDRMLAKAPDDRFQSAAEIAKALAPFAKGSDAVPPRSGDAPEPSATLLGQGETRARPVPSPLGLPGRSQPRSHVVKIGLATLVLVACAVGVGLWLGVGRGEGVVKHSASPVAQASVAATSRVDNSSTNASPETLLPEQQGPTPARHHRILFVLPTDKVWFADVGPIKSRFEGAGFRVDIAGTRTGACSFIPDKRRSDTPQLHCDLVVDATLKADRYDAVIFSGYGIGPFIDPGTIRYETSRLIREFQAEAKVVGGICVGQGILAHLGFLRETRAAGGDYVRRDFPYGGPAPGPVWTERPVEIVDQGRLITARDDTAADAFCDALLEVLTPP
jgi:eukaryotic-like serine/threonine-protein kinase